MASITAANTTSKSNGTLTPSTSSSRDRTERETPRRRENPSPNEGYSFPTASTANGNSRFGSAVSPHRRSSDGTGAGGISANTSSERETIEYRNGSINGKRRSPLNRELHLREPNGARDIRQRQSEERVSSSSSDRIAVKREPSASPNLNANKAKAPPAITTTASDGSSSQSSSQPANGAATKERASAVRHRPRKLDVSLANTIVAPRGAMTAREGPASNMHDIGIACLSPGFQPQDATMSDKVQRSVAVREQQRLLIEQRLQKGACGGSSLATSAEAVPVTAGLPTTSGNANREAATGATNEVGSTLNPFATSKLGSTNASGTAGGGRRGPPALSINASAANQLSHERVIQSAPLNRSFPGRIAESSLNAPAPIEHGSGFGRHGVQSQAHQQNQPARPLHGSPGHSAYQQSVHGSATQNNRLPSITDVFSGMAPASGSRPDSSNDRLMNKASTLETSPEVRRVREYRSAEEAVHELAGGREELLPRLVHYSGLTPQERETRPIHSHRRHISINNPQDVRISPQDSNAARHLSTLRRRTRAEYEHDNGSPPLGNGPGPRHGIPGHAGSNPVGVNASMYRPSLPSLSTPAASTHPHNYHRSNAAMSPRLSSGQYGYNDSRKFPSPASRPIFSVPAAHHGESPKGHTSQDRARIEQGKKEEFLGLMSRAWDLFHSM
ncbi:hypothetical protein KEM56_003121 [Ascosphaera pollenicola]|nr:hypothetical protein KEM56_003121 [Ascosphaera pollenicola]